MTPTSKPPATPTISVIVPSFNAAHYLERSLPPLIAMREKGDVAEVIVIDDCSTDPSNVETATRLGADVLRMPKNGGPGAARNLAAQSAVGEILWLVDADVVAHLDGPAQIKDAFADPEVAAVFGSYDANPPARNFASSYKNLVHRYYHQRGRADSETFWAGCGALRKSVYHAVGGFDGGKYGRPSIEDIELGCRIKAAGWSIRLLSTLHGTHLKKWSLPEVVRTDIFQRAIPWSHLILSGEGPSDDLNVAPVERLKAVFACLWLASLFAMLVPLFWPHAFTAFAVMTGVVSLLNWRLIRFFAVNRGPGFAVFAAAYHQFYYLYSSMTFALCALSHFMKRKPSAA